MYIYIYICISQRLAKSQAPGLVHPAFPAGRPESQTLRPGANPWLLEGVAHPTARSLQIQAQDGPGSSGRGEESQRLSYLSVDFIHLDTSLYSSFEGKG